jgi:hypothetical protein
MARHRTAPSKEDPIRAFWSSLFNSSSQPIPTEQLRVAIHQGLKLPFEGLDPVIPPDATVSDFRLTDHPDTIARPTPYMPKG